MNSVHDLKPGSESYRVYRWGVVALLWAICVLNYADRQAVFSVFSILEKTYGFDKKELGLIGSAFMIVYAGLSPVAGWVGDRVRRKWIIVGGLATWSVFTAATSLCGKLWSFVFVRGAEGLGETFYFPASTSLISDYHAGDTRSRALGLHHTGTYVGTILGGVLTGWLAERYGWRTPFVVFGAAGVALSVVLVYRLREPGRNEAEARHPDACAVVPRVPLRQFLPELLRNGPVLTLVAVFLLGNFVTLPFYAWLPLFLAERFGLGVAEAAFAGTFYLQGASAIGALIGGHVADRWRGSTPGGRIFTQAVGVCGYAPFLLLASRTPTYPVCIAAMCALGLFKGMYDANVWASFYDLVPVSRRGTLCGFANALAWVGGSVSVFLIGFAVDAGWATMSEALQCLPVLNVLMTVGLVWTGRRAA